jgi:3-oxoadipate enol-lactonase
MDAKANGGKLFYRQSGAPESPALLLIHGFPLDSGMWEAQLDGLADRANVIAPDLRGHGQSDPAPGPTSMEQHADDLAGLLDTLRIEKALIAGFSMGGYVALAFWRRHPERVAALALVDTRATADTPEGRDGRTATIERVRTKGVVVLADEMLPKLLTPASLSDKAIAGLVREMVLRQAPEGMIASLEAMRERVDNTAMLGTVNAPAFVIGGEYDQITPPEVTVTMAKQIPDGRSVLVVNAGHLSPVENPHDVNMALSELLSIARF